MGFIGKGRRARARLVLGAFSNGFFTAPLLLLARIMKTASPNDELTSFVERDMDLTRSFERPDSSRRCKRCLNPRLDHDQVVIHAYVTNAPLYALPRKQSPTLIPKPQ